jgi:hypothetical protein
MPEDSFFVHILILRLRKLTQDEKLLGGAVGKRIKLESVVYDFFMQVSTLWFVLHFCVLHDAQDIKATQLSCVQVPWYAKY